VHLFHPPTQETTALAVEECVTLEAAIVAMNLLCFGGFRTVEDDPPKAWRSLSRGPKNRGNVWDFL
jgi:hypothetical protein